MPVEYLILPDLDVTYVKYYGHVSTPQIELAFDVHQTDDDFRPGRSEFADLSLVADLEMDFAGVKSHFERMENAYWENAAATFTAIFAPRPEQASLAYAYAKLSNGSQILHAQVFEEASEALCALGLEISAREFFEQVAEDVE